MRTRYRRATGLQQSTSRESSAEWVSVGDDFASVPYALTDAGHGPVGDFLECGDVGGGPLADGGVDDAERSDRMA